MFAALLPSLRQRHCATRFLSHCARLQVEFPPRCSAQHTGNDPMTFKTERKQGNDAQKNGVYVSAISTFVCAEKFGGNRPLPHERGAMLHHPVQPQPIRWCRKVARLPAKHIAYDRRILFSYIPQILNSSNVLRTSKHLNVQLSAHNTDLQQIVEFVNWHGHNCLSNLNSVSCGTTEQ